MNHSGSYPSLSACTSWYKSSAGTTPSFTHCLPVGCNFFVFWFIQILIDLYPNNSIRTAVVVIPNNFWWNALMFYHLWCQTKVALMRTSINNPLFSSNYTTWLMCIPLGQRKHSWSVTPHSAWSAILPYAMEWEMACKYTAYPYPSTTFVYKGCLSKVCHDGCDGKESVRGPKCTYYCFNYSVWWKCKLGVECPFYKGFFGEELVVLFQVFLLGC